MSDTRLWDTYHSKGGSGPAWIRDLLTDWISSFVDEVEPSAPHLGHLVASAPVFPAEAFLRKRLCVIISDAELRNDLLRQLAMSPVRRRDWAGVRCTARLTAHQERHRRAVLTAFQVPGDSRAVNRDWLQGRRV